jgi:hypothetical protein
MDYPQEIQSDMVLPTLGTQVTPHLNFNGVVPLNLIFNEDINVNPLYQATYPLGFKPPYFVSDQVNKMAQQRSPDESEYLQGIKAGLGPLRNFNDENRIPTNFNFTTMPMKNLNLAVNNISYKHSDSWSGQPVSRSEYSVNQGKQILGMEVLARGSRLY